MDDEIKKKILEIKKGDKEYFESWLQKFQDVIDAAPTVLKNLEQISLDIEALENTPDEAKEFPLPSRILQNSERASTFFRRNIPDLPDIHIEPVLHTASVTVSGSSDVWDYVHHVSDIETPATIAFAEEYGEKYLSIQKNQNRIKETRELIGRMGNEDTVGRFDLAFDLIEKYKSDAVDKASVANSIRNLFDGVRGVLIERARRYKKESLNWDSAIPRFANSEDNLTFLNGTKTKWSTLQERLGSVLHGREAGSATDLINIWTQSLDLLFSLLNFIEEK